MGARVVFRSPGRDRAPSAWEDLYGPALRGAAGGPKFAGVRAGPKYPRPRGRDPFERSPREFAREFPGRCPGDQGRGRVDGFKGPRRQGAPWGPGVLVRHAEMVRRQSQLGVPAQVPEGSWAIARRCTFLGPRGVPKVKPFPGGPKTGALDT